MLILYNKLTQEEIVKFERMVNSSYFNTVENVKKLFYYLKSKHPGITEKDISQTEISKQIYSDETISTEMIWKLKSDFSKVFEKFLVQNVFENDKAYNDMCLLKELREKGSEKEFKLLLNNLKKQSDKQFIKEDLYYMNKVTINNEEIYFRFTNIQFELHENLQAKSDNLDYYFLFMKFHTFHEMIMYQYQNGKILNFNKNFFDELTGFVKKNEKSISKDHPDVYVIYLVLMMFVNKDKKNFSVQFKKYLKQNVGKFTNNQLSYFYRYLESFYHLKINEGHTELRTELFELYKLMFDKDLFVLVNSITDKDFNNVINIVLPLGKFNWAEQYMEKYKSFIVPEMAEESYNLAKAKLYFYKKDFDKIFPHLNLIHYKDPHYYINAKILLAKVLYETNAPDSLTSILDSLRKYLRRDKNLNEPQIQTLKTFIKFISILSKIKSGNNTDEIAVLKRMMENEKKFISSKSWLKEKIEEIEFKKIRKK